MMLSSSAVDRVLGIQTGNHAETHRPWTPGVRPPRIRPQDLTTAKTLEGQHDRRRGGREEERGTPIHRSCLFLARETHASATGRASAARGTLLNAGPDESPRRDYRVVLSPTDFSSDSTLAHPTRLSPERAAGYSTTTAGLSHFASAGRRCERRQISSRWVPTGSGVSWPAWMLSVSFLTELPRRNRLVTVQRR